MNPRPPPDDESDDALVQRARVGDRAAFGELVRRHQMAALRVAAAVTGSTEEARDIVQDAFVQGYRALDRYRGEAPVRCSSSSVSRSLERKGSCPVIISKNRMPSAYRSD